MEGLYKEEIFALLDQKGIPYERMDHEAVFTMEAMDQAGITKKGCVCKNLFLRNANGKQHYLVTAPEHKRVDMKQLAQEIEEEMERERKKQDAASSGNGEIK